MQFPDPEQISLAALTATQTQVPVAVPNHVDGSLAQGAGGTPSASACGLDLRAQVVRCIAGALEFVLRRQRSDYPFIDTKFSLITGESFAADDPLRGPSVVYTWIQGRGLESLAMHGAWLHTEASIDADSRTQMLAVIDALLPKVVAAMESVRTRSGGHLPFMMNVQGHVLSVDAQGCVVPMGDPADDATSLSDLFYAKGLVAAARYLGSPALADAATALFDEAVADIRSGRFRFGQIALDPKNPVQTVAGRFSHAGRMIGIGAATLFYEVTGQSRYAQLGIEFIEHILRWHTLTDFTDQRSHVAQQMDVNLQAGDFWEFVDAGGFPWCTPAGKVWSDCGHATEFVGLSLAHLRATGLGSDALRAALAQVLFRNFENGFSGLGIIKAFDLSGRMPINTDMPWWSLPETMRAAALLAMDLPAAAENADALFRQCWSTFGDHYIKPELGFSAVQCIDAKGAVIATIPATPDADPGYHTGLSLLGCLPWLVTRGRGCSLH